jgi:hypothetical protein
MKYIQGLAWTPDLDTRTILIKCDGVDFKQAKWAVENTVVNYHVP